MILFSIHIGIDEERSMIDYTSVREYLNDDGLKTLMDSGAVASLWRDQLRLTPDLRTWDKLTRAVRGNAGVLWREP